VDSDEQETLRKAIEMVLSTISRETRIDREWLGLEIEQVVTRAIFEAHRIGRGRRRASGVIPVVIPERKPDE
jgi:hypothetical protein